MTVAIPACAHKTPSSKGPRSLSPPGGDPPCPVSTMRTVELSATHSLIFFSCATIKYVIGVCDNVALRIYALYTMHEE
jgi:hypothetical protein